MPSFQPQVSGGFTLSLHGGLGFASSERKAPDTHLCLGIPPHAHRFLSRAQSLTWFCDTGTQPTSFLQTQKPLVVYTSRSTVLSKRLWITPRVTAQHAPKTEVPTTAPFRAVVSHEDIGEGGIPIIIRSRTHPKPAIISNAWAIRPRVHRLDRGL
jgi:hypothetical protein